MSTGNELQNILDNLRSSIPEVRGVLIASVDGMPVTQNLLEGDANRLAAMVATALSLGKRICESFGGGALQETSISGQTSQVYIYAAGNKAVLSVLSGGGANVGLIHLEARNAAQKIAQILG